MELMPPPGAVGCFSVYSSECIEAVISAAELECRPAIVSMDQNVIKDTQLDEMAREAFHMARASSVPISVHLNHAESLEGIKVGLDLGFSSVMFDGSNLDFDENIRQTCEARIMAHAYGSEIEGEYGMLCITNEDLEKINQFLRKTMVDYLAFSADKSMTMQKQKQSLLTFKQLVKESGVPLVLHGASNIDQILLKKFQVSGVRKINVHSEILKAMKDYQYEINMSCHKVSQAIYKSEIKKIIKQVVQNKIKQFLLD
ncbi:ketose-bisphosphate aldolase class-II [Desulfonatronospira thiodismutans ASO3-1]|uniref:Ketose-bisphosphate aldolase class-II n=2 Tax=Desulfonatronospira thiodismutans TaxID=488939 RepID=D6SKG7_9BACT|nr:ketose-bisphosphate aldolase class-II [Desulfonatronospira thiodismutans ASO3-1]